MMSITPAMTPEEKTKSDMRKRCQCLQMQIVWIKGHIQPLSVFKSFKEEVFLSRLGQAQHFPAAV
jgi:hypothetical protein